MTRSSRLGLAALMLAALPAAAQAPKVSGLVQVWFVQPMDNKVSLNSTPTIGNYFNLRGEFKQNGFAVRRTEIKLAGTITDDVEYEVMFDPSINNNGNDKNIVMQDAAIKMKLPVDGLELRVGQFKNLQTFEGLTSSSELLFVERSMMGRYVGDARDRGGVLSYAFGSSDFSGKAHVGVFNGSGKANETTTNAYKDYVARLDFNYGKTMKFGVYTLQGATDVADKTGAKIVTAYDAKTYPGWPTTTAIYDNKDKTSNLGGYFVYQDDVLHASAEVITGEWGRRYATLNLAAPKREHLNQTFMGYVFSFGYTLGNHTILGRYDYLDYNSGSQWYTASSPYIVAGKGDFTPKYTELSLGYLYAFKPEKIKAANIKVNYIVRSKNIFMPRADQFSTSAQGFDTFVVAFQTAF